MDKMSGKCEILVMVKIGMSSMVTEIVEDRICLIMILIGRIEGSGGMRIVIVSEDGVNVEVKKSSKNNWNGES
ncbi:hypothetical protein, partial [Staphylococcus epidermidis]|uniref:hypothetical protein n=1 Tax=Staphylococcus epidermidis TaxID=1282 RepID=UPI001C933ADE